MHTSITDRQSCCCCLENKGHEKNENNREKGEEVRKKPKTKKYGDIESDDRHHYIHMMIHTDDLFIDSINRRKKHTKEGGVGVGVGEHIHPSILRRKNDDRRDTLVDSFARIVIVSLRAFPVSKCRRGRIQYSVSVTCRRIGLSAKEEQPFPFTHDSEVNLVSHKIIRHRKKECV